VLQDDRSTSRVARNHPDLARIAGGARLDRIYVVRTTVVIIAMKSAGAVMTYKDLSTLGVALIGPSRKSANHNLTYELIMDLVNN
jgi:hypothetical protein